MADVVEQNAENKEQVNYLMNKQKKCAHQKEVLQGRLVQFEQEQWKSNFGLYEI